MQPGTAARVPKSKTTTPGSAVNEKAFHHALTANEKPTTNGRGEETAKVPATLNGIKRNSGGNDPRHGLGKGGRGASRCRETIATKLILGAESSL